MEGGYRDLCNRCFNEEVAETGGIGGYEFQVLGDAEADLFELMGQMVPRIRPTARAAASENRTAHAGIAYRRFHGPRSYHLG
jgi:hypothetical protein